jgi:hypothetical protein
LFIADNGAYYTTLIYETAGYQQFRFLSTDPNPVINAYAARTTETIRDPSAHYHVVLAVDTTQAVATDRVRIFVNGVQSTLITELSGFPSLNYDTYINSTVLHETGGFRGTNYLDGYLSEINFIDGQALTPASFGEFNSDGVWIPKAYGGTYGTNGFYLKFNNGSTAANLGLDSSGNGNTWTVTNVSVTAGATYDWMTDTPTDNYAVLNPLNELVAAGSGGSTLSNGNIQLTGPGGADGSGSLFVSTLAASTGKWYAEATTNPAAAADFAFGIYNSTLARLYSAAVSANVRGSDGSTAAPREIYKNGVLVQTGLAAWATNDVCGLAVDLDAGTIQFYRNNVAYGSLVTGLTAATYCIGAYASKNFSTVAAVAVNFGQRPFAYAPPSGFVALRTSNLPAALIANGEEHFDAYLYTGNGGGLQVGEIQKPLEPYTVQRSVRFRASATAYLSRTPSVNGSLNTWSLSLWMKRGALSTNLTVFHAGTNGTTDSLLYFQVGNTFEWLVRSGGIATGRRISTQIFADPSVHGHFLFVWDTTNATASDRMRVFWNGVRLTSFSSSQDPTLNATSPFNAASIVHNLGRNTSGAQPFDGYFSETNFIDGQALNPSSFGQTDGNGYWVPKAYTGTYGTNGFYLPFTDTTTPTTLCEDSSGNNNDWTPNNISLTAGATYDSMVDVPGNSYAVIDVLQTPVAPVTYKNGNLGASGNNVKIRSTYSISAGKFYWEAIINAYGSGDAEFGIITQAGSINSQINNNPGTYGFGAKLGRRWDNGVLVSSAFGATSLGVVLGFAVDLDAYTFTVFRGGTQLYQTTSILPNLYAPTFTSGGVSGADDYTVNFGQHPFAYTPPSGFLALSENNLPEDENDMESPGLVWIKNRSAVQDHALFDQVRGATKQLRSNTTGAETTDVNSLIEFNRNGFYLGASAAVNTANQNYVAWAWKANGAGSTNTAGSITSTVSVNTTAGISVVTYTGTGANATVGHGLGAAPAFLIVKRRDSAGFNWLVWHSALTGTEYLLLESTNARATAQPTVWNSTIPTSTVFSVGTNTAANASGGTYVGYCFSEVAGFSKFGRYVGNGVVDGPFVYCGFRPRYVLMKCSSSDLGASAQWVVKDSTRSPNNAALANLYPNLTNVEDSTATAAIDVLSNGFKIRGTYTPINSSTNTIIYIAFAENPFGGSNVNPVNAR